MFTKNPEFHTAKRHAIGFSLIELLVAIGIIALLASLVIVARTALFRNVQINQTKIILGNLQNALTEYEVAVGVKIWHYSIGGERPDWTIDPRPIYDETTSSFTSPTTSSALTSGVDDTSADQILGNRNASPPPVWTEGTHVTIERFIYVAWQHDNVKPMLTQFITSDRFEDTDADGFPEITDAWGTPIYYAQKILPILPTGNDFVTDNRFNASRDPVFISAGPDQRFGDVANFMDDNEAEEDLNSDGTGDGIDDSLDNIYSNDS